MNEQMNRTRVDLLSLQILAIAALFAGCTTTQESNQMSSDSEDDLGNEQVTGVAIQSDTVPIPPSIVLAHPAFHPFVNNAGNIQMCQLPGGPGQCDYAVGNLSGSTFTPWPAAGLASTGIAAVKTVNGSSWTGDLANYFPFIGPFDPSHVYVPLQGLLDAGATTSGNCTIKSISSTRLTLIKSIAGGFCSINASFSGSIIVDIRNPQTAHFRTLLDFNNNPGAMTGNVDCSLTRISSGSGGLSDAVKPTISISMLADCGGVLVPRVASLGPGSTLPLPFNISFINI